MCHDEFVISTFWINVIHVTEHLFKSDRSTRLFCRYYEISMRFSCKLVISLLCDITLDN